MSGSNPIVAIVGRPNVGKSTLFNRLARKRKSIIHPDAGITRDRVYETVQWSGRQFTLIDTGGYIPSSQDKIETAIRQQVNLAIDEADLVLFLTDTSAALMPLDEEIASLLRQSQRPVLLVVNKCDNEVAEQNRYEFFRFGFGEPFPISALNGRRIGDLLDQILEQLPRPAPLEKSEDENLALAIIGAPNAGKSSLLNALLGIEKAIVTDIPGTTRDSIDSVLKYYGETMILIDTAGLRRKRNIQNDIEYYSMVRTEQAIERCHVAIMVVDAAKGFTRQDGAIIRLVIDRKKGLVVALNKWDLIEKDTRTAQEYRKELIREFHELEHYPVQFISALTKQRVFKLLEVAKTVHQARQQRIPTNRLNDFFQNIFHSNPPPSIQGRLIKIKYVAQVKYNPPVFVFFCNEPRAIKEDYRRFIEKQIREQFGFDGVPITISFRSK